MVDEFVSPITSPNLQSLISSGPPGVRFKPSGEKTGPVKPERMFSMFALPSSSISTLATRPSIDAFNSFLNHHMPILSVGFE